MQPPRFDLGNCTITLIDGGEFKLDGGQMFGVIPKVLWQRKTPADELNRVSLAANCLLVEWKGESGRRALIETGCGAKHSEKERQQFGLNPERWLLTELENAGVGADTITDVILTHLHFDHAGGLTMLRDGNVCPTFPKATVHVQRQELDDARTRYGTTRFAYQSQNIEPILEADSCRVMEGEEEILPGIRPLLTPGHTRGHQSVVVQGSDRTAVVTGDVLPTAAHLGAFYNMAFDVFPVENRASKSRLLRKSADEQWLVFIEHEIATPAMTVTADGDWYAWTPAR